MNSIFLNTIMDIQSWITIARFLLKINIHRLLCTVIKFQEVLYFGQDFYVNFDRGTVLSDSTRGNFANICQIK